MTPLGLFTWSGPVGADVGGGSGGSGGGGGERGSSLWLWLCLGCLGDSGGSDAEVTSRQLTWGGRGGR